MERERHPKRRRIANAGSSFGDSDATASPIADPPVRTDEYVPSAMDISTELRSIEGSSSAGTSLQALKQLQEWLMSGNIESSTSVLENFHCYGGVARVLDFLEANMADWDCLVGTAATIADLLSFRWSTIEQMRKTAIEIANMIIRRNGIQLLIRANREHAVMHKISSDTKHIWIALGRTMNGEETLAMIDKKQKLRILNDAIDCIHHLEIPNGNSTGWTSDVLQVVLYAIANTIKDASIENEDLNRTDIVTLNIRIMNTDDNWNQNETVVTYALGVLAICTKKAIVSKNEFEQILPMLIYCIRNFCENTLILSFVLTLLESACEKKLAERIESTGVLEAISALLKSESLGKEKKQKVRDIMGMIINGKNVPIVSNIKHEIAFTF